MRFQTTSAQRRSHTEKQSFRTLLKGRPRKGKGTSPKSSKQQPHAGGIAWGKSRMTFAIFEFPHSSSVDARPSPLSSGARPFSHSMPFYNRCSLTLNRFEQQPLRTAGPNSWSLGCELPGDTLGISSEVRQVANLSRKDVTHTAKAHDVTDSPCDRLTDS